MQGQLAKVQEALGDNYHIRLPAEVRSYMDQLLRAGYISDARKVFSQYTRLDTQPAQDVMNRLAMLAAVTGR